LIKLFTWEDFKQFNIPPETLAAYCNELFYHRTTPVSLCRHNHDILRNDAGFMPEVLEQYPNEARMTNPTTKNNEEPS
jgi:hypothetical protein